jgi:orotidine-5'-phosphate decarboxylase
MQNSTTPLNPTSQKPRFFVALDLPSADEAVALAHTVQPYVGGFKIGLELFTAQGPSIVDRIGPRDVFLDLKFHDIPNTVAGAARNAARLGVAIFNVHCLGGLEMMRIAQEAAREVNDAVKIIGVTVLTSHDRASIARLGLDEEPESAVRRLALLAREAGLDGVVCSAREIRPVRQECGDDFMLVTPGIRPASAEVGDQKRVMTPHAALEAGADWLVIGRPITAAADPAEAARRVFDE